MRIDITNVHRRYDDVAALDGVDFTVESGEAYGLVGTNGAGKSTLFGRSPATTDPTRERLRSAIAT